MNHNIQAVDFIEFHQQQLPQQLLTGGNALAADAASQLPVLAIKLVESGQCYSYVPQTEAIRIEPGMDSAAAVVELELQTWLALVADLESVPGIVYGGKLGNGSTSDTGIFADWEPVLRSIYHGLPIYDPARVEITDSAGNAIDVNKTFTLNDSLDSMAEFFDATGFLVVGQVFSSSEIERFRQQAEELRNEAQPTDNHSWWGKDHRGESVCTRVLLGGVKPAFSGLYEDPRMMKLQSLMPASVSPWPADEVDGVTVIYKTPKMSEGLSDLPWHRDCGMGGHAQMCPAVNLSIYLQDANASSGELRFLPGSHKAVYGNNFEGAGLGIAAAAKAGSVSLHYSDVMHAAPPPQSATGPYRTSVLLSYKPAGGTHHGERHYNDVLLGAEGGQVASMQEMLKG